MNKFKRLFAFVPVVLVLLWSVVPFGVMAANTATSLPPNSYDGDLSGAYPTLDQVSQNGIYCTTDYLMYNVISANGNNIWTSYDIMQYYFTIYIPLNNFDYSVSDGIYSFSLKSGKSSSDAFLWSANCLISSSATSLPSTSFYSSLKITTDFIFDINTNTLLINNDDFLNHPSLTNNNKLDYFFMSYDFVLNSEPVNKGEIIVDSFPKLEGDSTLNMYLLDDNGYPIPDKTSDRYLSTQIIDIDISNNSSKDFQFALYIVPKGQSLSLVENPREMLGSRFFSSNPLFIYCTEEWIYNISKVLISRESYAVSCYHLVKSGQTFTCHVGENQIDLKKDVEYDLVVFGSFVAPHSNEYLNSYYFDVFDRPLNSYTISCIDPYIHFDSSNAPTEFYRKTFTLDRDTSYKNTQYSQDDSLQIGGLGTSYPFDPNTSNDEIFNTVYASKDDNGVPDFHNSKFDGSYDSKHYDYAPNDRYNSNVGINSNLAGGVSLTSSFNSFFGMITDLLKHLPGPFLNVFIFGFTALVVVAIVKAVR